jgi:hypothetical protein
MEVSKLNSEEKSALISILKNQIEENKEVIRNSKNQKEKEAWTEENKFLMKLIVKVKEL